MSAALDREQVKAKIKALIEGELKIKIESDDYDLVGTDTIDSYTMMLLILFINNEFGVKLDMEQLDFDAFGSINTIVGLVTDSN
jgi:acyl carrier protein